MSIKEAAAEQKSEPSGIAGVLWSSSDQADHSVDYSSPQRHIQLSMHPPNDQADWRFFLGNLLHVHGEFHRGNWHSRALDGYPPFL
jgi:hypothetical protein